MGAAKRDKLAVVNYLLSVGADPDVAKAAELRAFEVAKLKVEPLANEEPSKQEKPEESEKKSEKLPEGGPRKRVKVDRSAKTGEGEAKEGE
ncbi:unnamed protein product [Sphagnum balticum]